jgi:hypothetical protein
VSQWGVIHNQPSVAAVILVRLIKVVHQILVWLCFCISSTTTSIYPFLRFTQPGGPVSCIYFPQEQGSIVIPPQHWVYVINLHIITWYICSSYMYNTYNRPLLVQARTADYALSRVQVPTQVEWLERSYAWSPQSLILIYHEAEVKLGSTISRPVCLGVGLPSGAHDQIFVFCLTIAVSCCRAPSLTRGWVCNLLVQLFLYLAKVITLGSKSRRTQIVFYCPILDSPNLEGQVPVFISPVICSKNFDETCTDLELWFEWRLTFMPHIYRRSQIRETNL